MFVHITKIAIVRYIILKERFAFYQILKKKYQLEKEAEFKIITEELYSNYLMDCSTSFIKYPLSLCAYEKPKIKK